MAKAILSKDLRELDAKKLGDKIAEIEKDLLAARKAHSDQSLPNPRVIAAFRKDIARVKTILNEKRNQEEK